MSFQHLIDKVMSGGSQAPQENTDNNHNASQSTFDSLKSKIPGGLAGGAAAGGIMALLLGNKSTRKMLGKVAKYGGTALLGGMAYKAYQNWQDNKSPQQAQPVSTQDIQQAQIAIPQQGSPNELPLHLTLIKSMIGAAKADGQIDADEQKHIFDAVEKMQLSAIDKAIVFDSMNQEIKIEELARSVTNMEHKAEVYLAAYLAIDPDHPDEISYLNNLATALELPADFIAHLQHQVAAENPVVAA